MIISSFNTNLPFGRISPADFPLRNLASKHTKLPSRFSPSKSLVINDNLMYSQVSGISKGISSSEMGVSTRSFFLSLPALKSCFFSSRIFSNNTEAGSSLGSCGTKRPSIASWRMLFFKRSGSSSFNLLSSSCALPYFSTFGNSSSISATMRYCSARGGRGINVFNIFSAPKLPWLAVPVSYWKTCCNTVSVFNTFISHFAIELLYGRKHPTLWFTNKSLWVSSTRTL